MHIYLSILVFYISCFGLLRGQESVYANDDLIKGLENNEVNISVLNNDFGLSEGVSSLKITVEASHGQAIVNEDNSITFIPDRSFVGKDEFVYEVCNTDGNCDEAKVFVEIEDVDFMPVAVNDTISYLHGSSIEVNFLDNDTIEGDEPITVSIIGELKQGSHYLNSDNLLEIEFERRFIGLDSLDYIICDADDDCIQARIIFDVRHGGDIEFFIPQGFSPNGDGINDTFYVPDFSTYQGISATIVDSWGSIVYQQSDYQNDWNGIANKGNNKGKLVQAGTYYYIFKIEGVSKQITGYVYVAK